MAAAISSSETIAVPLYEYQCDACGRRFEVIQKFSDPPIEVCPTCGAAVHKLASSPAIQFKGSGWYVTDYAKKDQSSAKTDSAAKPDAAKTDEAKSDMAKDAGATETKSEKTDKKASSTDSASPSSSKT